MYYRLMCVNEDIGKYTRRSDLIKVCSLVIKFIQELYHRIMCGGLMLKLS